MEVKNKVLVELFYNATEKAKELNSKYVLVEHLLYALMSNQSFLNSPIHQSNIEKYNCVVGDVEKYLNEFDLIIKNESTNGETILLSQPLIDFILYFEVVSSCVDPHIIGDETVIYLIVLSSFLFLKNTQSYQILNDNGITQEFVSILLQGSSLERLIKDQLNDDIKQIINKNIKNHPQNNEQVLSNYLIDINEKVSRDDWVQIIGRSSEIDLLEQIVLRKDKPNAILVGHPGVGKTKIIEGFVKKIIQDDKPYKVYQLNILEFTSSIFVKGELEKRVIRLINFLQNIPNSILFIDEIHTICGNPDSSSQGEISDLLKPLLVGNGIRLIGATTHDEYRKYVERNEAFSRRFSKIIIDENTICETLDILKNIKQHYEKFFGITYSDDSINSILKLTQKYIHNKYYPDKAIDVLDMVGAYCKHNNHITVDSEHIKESLSVMLNMPISKLAQTEEELYKSLESTIRKKIIGQDAATTLLSDSVIISKSGLRENNKTATSLMFMGPSGVGKTEICKVLSSILNIPLVRFDMSEFMEEHSVSKLLGSPPGYKGFSDGKAGNGLLINAIDENPYCILLLDEIEKANPKIHNILLQVMDNGKLTSSNGKTVSFENVFLVMTSNVGSYNAHKKGIGFNNFENTSDKDYDDKFLPEFRNRIDSTVKFNSLNTEMLKQICVKFINELTELLKDKNIQIKVDNDVINYIVDKAIKQQSGARPIKHIITNEIKNVLAKNIMFGNYVDNQLVNVSLKNNNIIVE